MGRSMTAIFSMAPWEDLLSLAPVRVSSILMYLGEKITAEFEKGLMSPLLFLVFTVFLVHNLGAKLLASNKDEARRLVEECQEKIREECRKRGDGQVMTKREELLRSAYAELIEGYEEELAGSQYED